MESPLVLLFFILKDSWLIKPHECCKVWSLSLESGSHPQDTRHNPPGLFRKTMENHGKPIESSGQQNFGHADLTSHLSLNEIPWIWSKFHGESSKSDPAWRISHSQIFGSGWIHSQCPDLCHTWWRLLQQLSRALPQGWRSSNRINLGRDFWVVTFLS